METCSARRRLKNYREAAGLCFVCAIFSKMIVKPQNLYRLHESQFLHKTWLGYGGTDTSVIVLASWPGTADTESFRPFSHCVAALGVCWLGRIFSLLRWLLFLDSVAKSPSHRHPSARRKVELFELDFFVKVYVLNSQNRLEHRVHFFLNTNWE